VPTPSSRPATLPNRRPRATLAHRRASLGTQSSNGEHFADAPLGRCGLQRRSLFTYLSDLITARTLGNPFPRSRAPQE